MTRSDGISPSKRRLGFALLVVLALGIVSGVWADNDYEYPRRSLGTGNPMPWVRRDSLDWLAQFEELYTPAPVETIAVVLDSMDAHGYTRWVDSTEFIQIIMPQCIEVAYPQQDGLLQVWEYDLAKSNFGALFKVASYHNSVADTAANWMLFEADEGDTLFVWSFKSMLANLTPWCPKGTWDGEVEKVCGNDTLRWNFGSTRGLTALQWICSVAVDSIFVHNDLIEDVLDGIQFEDGLDRWLACWTGFTRDGDRGNPDPKADGTGLSCTGGYDSEWMDSTWAAHDTLLTDFVQIVRDSGDLLVRVNGHQVHCVVQPAASWPCDTLLHSSVLGCKLEEYGDWGDENGPFPQDDSTHGWWFDCYEAVEETYDPLGIDRAEGWDVSTIQSHPEYADSTHTTTLRSARFTRCNLAQSLMGDGFFDGQAWRGDPYFYAFFAGDTSYAPFSIDEMTFALGNAVGSYRTYCTSECEQEALISGTTKPLHYRQFRKQTVGQPQEVTVVVNFWDFDQGDIPAHDAKWFYGHHRTFPQPDSLLVFDHWDERAIRKPPSQAPYALAAPPFPGKGGHAIRFHMPAAERIGLTIHDINGRKVRTLLSERLDAGPHSVLWDGSYDDGARATSGVYFWRLSGQGYADRGRLVILK